MSTASFRNKRIGVNTPVLGLIRKIRQSVVLNSSRRFFVQGSPGTPEKFVYFANSLYSFIFN